jgi:hypothetical protein
LFGLGAYLAASEQQNFQQFYTVQLVFVSQAACCAGLSAWQPVVLVG